MNFMSTVKGSALEGFYPQGWDMKKIDECCEKGTKKEAFWNKKFKPVACDTVADLDTYMGHEIALQIKKARDRGEKLAMILPVGPMGMYKWAVYFLKEWNVCCDKLGKLTVPESQRNFATKTNLPTYPEKLAKLKAEGAKLVLIYGIGRMCHIAFWEPTIGAEFDNDEEWAKQPYRIGVKLHPLTIEQNAITSFKSRTTLVPCRANTIGPGLFLQADYAIGGADGALSRGMGWQGMSFLTTLHYGPDRHITSTYIPTLPGKLFYLKELAGPLVAECN